MVSVTVLLLKTIAQMHGVMIATENLKRMDGSGLIVQNQSLVLSQYVPVATTISEIEMKVHLATKEGTERFIKPDGCFGPHFARPLW